MRRALPIGVLVLLQLLVAAWLGHGQGWHSSTGSEAIAALLLAVQVALVYALAGRISGRVYALAAGVVLVLAPVVLAKRYFVIGGPDLDYKTVYRQSVLPTEFGLTDRAQLVAACLFLAATLVVVLRAPATAWTAAAAAALTGGAVLVSPRTWPALLAPVLAAAAGRKALPLVAAAATAGAALLLLALTRHVPHVPVGWHDMGRSLGGVREYTWSRRVLEYLPIAGVIGLARRSFPAALFVGMVVLATVVFPLARPLSLTDYLFAIVPGMSAYWLLAASIGFLWPRGEKEPATAAQQPHSTMRQ